MKRPEVPEVDVAAVVDALVSEHGTPSLSNKDDPFDELVYITLSLMTTEPSYQRVYARLIDQVPDWSQLLEMSVADVEALIAEAGLSRRKAASIRGCAARTLNDFGRVTLDPLHDMSTDDVERYLLGLPGVGLKTARCISLFSLSREVLPVDTHIGRLAWRLGMLVDDPKRRDPHAALDGIVPPHLRRSFHVAGVMHGRLVCRARAPRCEGCRLQPMCHAAQTG